GKLYVGRRVGTGVLYTPAGRSASGGADSLHTKGDIEAYRSIGSNCLRQRGGRCRTGLQEQVTGAAVATHTGYRGRECINVRGIFRRRAHPLHLARTTKVDILREETAGSYVVHFSALRQCVDVQSRRLAGLDNDTVGIRRVHSVVVVVDYGKG